MTIRSASSWANSCFGFGVTVSVVPYALIYVSITLFFSRVGIEPCFALIAFIFDFCVCNCHMRAKSDCVTIRMLLLVMGILCLCDVYC